VYKIQVETRGKACTHALPHVLQPQTMPSCLGGLWCNHMSHDFRPSLSVLEGSGAATHPPAPDLAPPWRWAPVLPRVLWLQTPLSHSRGLRCSHVSHCSPWAPRIKKGLAIQGMQRDSHVSKARTRVTEAPARCEGRRHHQGMQDVWTGRNSAMLQCGAVRLATLRHGWQGL
jgi:hypothetical protein